MTRLLRNRLLDESNLYCMASGFTYYDITCKFLEEYKKTGNYTLLSKKPYTRHVFGFYTDFKENVLSYSDYNDDGMIYDEDMRCGGEYIRTSLFI